MAIGPARVPSLCVLNSKLCCCVAGEHNSGFDPPENMFFMCNRGGNVQKTTFWRFWSKNYFLKFLGLFWLFFPQKFAKKHGEPLFRLLPTLPCLNFDLKWFLSDLVSRTNLQVSLFLLNCGFDHFWGNFFIEDFFYQSCKYFFSM